MKSPFAVKIGPSTELGLAMLIAIPGEGDAYSIQPIAVVANLNEAHELAEADFASRREALESGECPMCPEVYQVWATGIGGDYAVASEWPAA